MGKQGEWGYMFSLKRTCYTIIYTMEEQGEWGAIILNLLYLYSYANGSVFIRHGCMQFMSTFTRGRQEPNFYIPS